MKILKAKIILFTIISLLPCTSISAQEDSLQKGIAFFEQGNYEKAIKTLRKIKKKKKDIYFAFYYLGLAYEKQSKLNKAIKALETSIELNPKFAKSKTSLAYIYAQTGNLQKAIDIALDSIVLDSGDYTNYYTISFAYYKLGNYSEAIKYIDVLMEKKPNYESAQELRKNVLEKLPELIKKIRSEKDKEKERKKAKYRQKNETLKQFVTRVAKLPVSEYWKKQKDSLNFFIKYFKEEEASKGLEASKNNRRIKILSYPQPGYTDSARNSNISGIILVMVGFEADGKIRHAIVTKGLGYGLDEKAIRATKKIKFG